ncbi:MAG: AmmeMemoRadiSam system protein A [Lachnospiraceae bacterium]|nr:AmmeMemoRadiSam system protein A [Lachnospiraceae bacterium]
MGIQAAIMVPHPPLIIPEIGRGGEAAIQDTIIAYHEAARRVSTYHPETIILISPHQIMYEDYFHISPGERAEGDFGQFQAGNVAMQIAYDTELVEEICRIAGETGIPAGTMGECEKKLDHGTMVPLYFINQYDTEYKLVRIGLSGLPLSKHYELGQCIQSAVENLGRKAVVIASGDLSHRLKEDGPYGYKKEGPEYDKKIMDVMGRASFGELLDFSEEFLNAAGECGHRSFVIMAGALDQKTVQAEKLSYEGPFGVGYGVCTYEIKGQDTERNFYERFEKILAEKVKAQREKEDAYVSLARKTIEGYICTGEKPVVPEGLPQEMYEQKAGAFVSIKKQGRLRGCIGTIQAVQSNLAAEIIENAISAATRDPRFAPIGQEELKELSISVDVLGTIERISSPDELDVERYGVVVTKNGRRGLLLPNLEGIDTVREQIAIAKQKAGIGEDEDVELERFEVVRHH